MSAGNRNGVPTLTGMSINEWVQASLRYQRRQEEHEALRRECDISRTRYVIVKESGVSVLVGKVSESIKRRERRLAKLKEQAA